LAYAALVDLDLARGGNSSVGPALPRSLIQVAPYAGPRLAARAQLRSR
jgi:hypothetical protein